MPPFVTRPSVPRTVAAIGWALAATACGGGASSSGATTVFDPSGSPSSASPVDVTRSSDIERPYPALDGPMVDSGRWIGVSVLRDGVRFARPPRWTIRDASLEPGHSFVRYVSPNAYSFAIYERSDSPGASWRDILTHYEADVTANGATAIGQRVPMATGTNQGRAYTIDRKIESKDKVLSRSREIVLRGQNRIVLVQVVTSEETLSRLSDEILEVLRRVEVL
jgi:hypothetical protein